MPDAKVRFVNNTNSVHHPIGVLYEELDIVNVLLPQGCDILRFLPIEMFLYISVLLSLDFRSI